jgi:hypothetical protein
MFQVDFSLSGRDDVHHPPTLPLEWNYHTAEEEILLGPGYNLAKSPLEQCFLICGS